MKEKIIKAAIGEVISPSLGIIKQFEEIHNVIYEKGVPKVKRVDMPDKGTALVYFPVKDVDFFLVGVYKH
ncbi:MAG TPA: hypothetical protein VGB84_03155 [Arachidicoccus sp.]